MNMERRWADEDGWLGLQKAGSTPTEPEGKVFTDEQYQDLIDKEPDTDRRTIMQDAFNDKDWVILTEMIANGPDTEVSTAQAEED